MVVEQRRPSGPEVERRIEVWTPELLKQMIVESCVREQTGLCQWENLPREIQLGSFSQKALGCLSATVADPQHRERAAVIQWEPSRRIVMMTKDDSLQVGNDKEVPIVMRGYKADYDRTSQPIGTIHSHPNSEGLSPLDGVSFLADQNSKLHILASVGGEIGLIVTCQETVWLEHDNSADGRQRAVQEKVAKWEAIGFKMRDKIINSPELKERWSRDPQYRAVVLAMIIDEFYANVSKKFKFGYYRGNASAVTRILPKNTIFG